MIIENKNEAPATNAIIKITREQNEQELEGIGIPSDLFQFAPGATWLLEHPTITVSGHIDPNTGDISIAYKPEVNGH